MKPIQRVAFIGNHLPRRCGIATFTHDLHRAVSTARPDLETCVVAMTDPGGTYDYPPAVRFEIHDETIDDYVEAAEFLNDAGFDVVSLQHEYGIFGGEAGGNIIELLSRLEMPVVTTLHTVLAKPTPAQRDVMQRIIDTSAKIVVMSEKGQQLLRSVHDVPADKIEIIPHGIPDFPFRETHHAKAKFGFAGKTVILTFGLLSPNKGIEIMLDAMPGIIKSCPNAVYVILGATHPNLVRQQGEAYRDSLTARVRELGIEDHVVFFNQFVDQATLLDFISMCDVYVTPYLNEAQMTSGTLAYSFGLGKAVVSTPYWHAKELLSDGRGILVPFGDAKAISSEIAALLTNDVRRHAMRKRAYAASRSMTWAQTAKRYLTVFETAQRTRPARNSRFRSIRSSLCSKGHAIPEMRIGHFLSLCDSTGMLQHAVHSVPDRAHGYCVDDNARALLFASALAELRRSAFARDDHRTLCGIHPARMEPGHPSVPKFHELRPPMAGRVRARKTVTAGRFGRWPNAHARTPIHLAADGRRRSSRPRFPPSRSSRRRAPGPSRSWDWTPIARWPVGDVLANRHAQAIGRQVDVAVSCKSDAKTGSGLKTARLRQCAPSPGADSNGPGDPYATRTSRSASDRCVGSCRFRPRHRDTSDPLGPKASARSARSPKRSISSQSRRAATISACLAAWRADEGAEWLTGATARVRVVSGRKRPADSTDRS